MKMLNVGYNNFMNAGKVVSVVRYDSAPSRRMVTDARSAGTCIDGTQGHKTKTVVVMESGQIVLSALEPHDIQGEG